MKNRILLSIDIVEPYLNLLTDLRDSYSDTEYTKVKNLKNNLKKLMDENEFEYIIAFYEDCFNEFDIPFLIRKTANKIYMKKPRESCFTNQDFLHFVLNIKLPVFYIVGGFKNCCVQKTVMELQNRMIEYHEINDMIINTDI